MAPSWRSIASAASRSIKGYIAQQRDVKRGYSPSRGPPQASPGGSDQSRRQTWGQWAGQKLRRGSYGEYDVTSDRLALFPGWAARRYREIPIEGGEELPFDVDVFVSGFASKLTGVSFNTRAGKTFLRLAKSFAALPKLPVPGPETNRSTDDLPAGMSLPPLPDEITEESEMKALDDRLRRLELELQVADEDDAYASVSPRSHGFRTPSGSSVRSGFSNGFSEPSITTSSASVAPAVAELQRWHANLETRLHPFWSSVLPNRTLRVSLHASDPSLYDTDSSSSTDSTHSLEKRPLLTREVTTGIDGSFQLKFSVPWEKLCIHPAGVHIAFGGAGMEHELYVVAELLAPPSPLPSASPSPNRDLPLQPQLRFLPPSVTVTAALSIPLTCSSIRVISDIDDTVKMSGILSGARSIFRNVFVHDLKENVIRGMGDWYMGMWKRGVRFHYVSNSPFELLPVVNEFLRIAQLPPGSIRLRSYGGRSLFNGFLSAPAIRKRAAVLDVLNHFPDATFFLVGDSGEQDLELYVELARERREQILAIFIRDAGARGADADSVPPLDDPTGDRAYELRLFESPAASPATSASPRTPTSSSSSGRSAAFPPSRHPVRSMSEMGAGSPPPPALPRKPARAFSGSEMDTPTAPTRADDYFGSSAATPTLPAPGPALVTEEPQGSPAMSTTSARSALGRAWPPRGFRGGRGSPASSRPQTPSGEWAPQRGASYGQVGTEVERRRLDLQMRLWKARYEVPPHIPIRLFREPEECVEAEEILQRVQEREKGVAGKSA
ncbi:uncharacterized protein BXZ73DRAFT_42343 [Epithele typhae]|uniref:uncharacterized protein n=1 Tax=Epithele typhae TaxID=378194 RepID=UPI002007CCEB|nr:uncharacterized protein BXZ73DRAFT_42343 [Epithele typhae]KAH9940884.1 hypothetical protein BXZ73DRAFT_42343 [Epithele typhae]